MPIDYLFQPRHTQQQFPQTPQNADSDLRPCHTRQPCTGRSIQHPTGEFQQSNPPLDFGLHMQPHFTPLPDLPHQTHPPPKPRVPGIKHFQITTTGILWRGCTTRTAGTPP